MGRCNGWSALGRTSLFSPLASRSYRGAMSRIALSILAICTSAIAAESQFLTNVRQLIYEGKRSGEGYFSPDGKALIFQSEREAENPFYQIYLLNFESG